MEAFRSSVFLRSRVSQRCWTAASRHSTRTSTAASSRGDRGRTISRRSRVTGSRPIDIVVVNLYPFVKAAQNPETSFENLIEEIDIGGPSLVRAAAKNFADVIVVVSPSDYARVLEALDRPGGPSPSFRFDLARKAFAHTARYDSAIASTLSSVKADDAGFTRVAASGFPDSLTVNLRKVRDLRYGENPHQHAALYSGFGAHPGYSILQGKELSYTNLLDLDAAIRMVIEFKEPAAALIKHTNPCGAATGSSAADAYVRAREADSVSAFGAAVALNRSDRRRDCPRHRVHPHRRGHCARRR